MGTMLPQIYAMLSWSLTVSFTTSLVRKWLPWVHRMVVVMLKSEWLSLTKSDPAVKFFLAAFREPDFLDTRKALFGECINAMLIGMTVKKIH